MSNVSDSILSELNYMVTFDLWTPPPGDQTETKNTENCWSLLPIRTPHEAIGVCVCYYVCVLSRLYSNLKQ